METLTQCNLFAPVIQLIIALIIWELVKYTINRFLGKTIGTEYVPREECEKQQAKLEKELRTIRGILLMVAMESGIDRDELKKLTG
jgi:hypothetical protein